MSWVYLFVAGLFEIGWAIGLKYTDGFTRLVPTVLTAISMAISLGLLGIALKTLPVGTAYAIWTGVGAVGTAILGVYLLGEPATVGRIVCIGLIVSGIASLSEQSDGRSLIRISGSRARDMLAKVCSLDLHPAAFPDGAAAASSIDHTSVNLWRGKDVGDEATFYLLVFATFAESLWHTLLDSGAEYGIAIDTAGAWQP